MTMPREILQQQQAQRRPPSQVYTRGTVGAVKTRRNSGSIINEQVSQRRSRSQSRDTAHSSSRQQFHSTGVAANNHSNANASSSNGSVQSRSVQSSPSKTSNSRSNSNFNADTTKTHIKISKRVIEELNKAQNAADERLRIAAITNACEVLDHADSDRHDMELAYGAATALSKLLAVATNAHDEIRMILAATEMVFRGSPKAVTQAFSKTGNILLPNLLKHLDRFETRSLQHADISILNISKILHSCSRSSELRATLLRQHGLLSALSRVSTRVLSPEARLLRVRMIANLSNCEENKVLLFEQPELLDSVLRIGHFDHSDLARQYAGIALMELSSAPANQVALARNDTVLGTLVKMILVEKLAVTRESAITALQNLAFTKQNRSKLVCFKKGIVLEALKKALSSDPDAKARRRAAGALTNLACDDTADTLGQHKGLLETLAIVSSKDENMDVQTRASLALTKIASSIPVKSSCHAALLDALVVASLSKAPNSVSAVLRVKARAIENREVLARHPGIMDTLADICIAESSLVADRDNSVRAIMHLVNEDKNRKILCNRTVLAAIVHAANYKDPDLEEARNSAVRAIERLATELTNRNFMAHFDGLLVTVARAVEREARWEQSGRESEYGYLAKPLLMSLLVAM